MYDIDRVTRTRNLNINANLALNEDLAAHSYIGYDPLYYDSAYYSNGAYYDGLLDPRGYNFRCPGTSGLTSSQAAAVGLNCRMSADMANVLHYPIVTV